MKYIIWTLLQIHSKKHELSKFIIILLKLKSILKKFFEKNNKKIVTNNWKIIYIKRIRGPIN